MYDYVTAITVLFNKHLHVCDTYRSINNSGRDKHIWAQLKYNCTMV